VADLLVFLVPLMLEQRLAIGLADRMASIWIGRLISTQALWCYLGRPFPTFFSCFSFGLRRFERQQRLGRAGLGAKRLPQG